MDVAAQLDRLVELGLPALAGISPAEFAGHAAGLPDEPGAVLAVHPSLVPAATLTTLLRRDDKPGFVVVDLTDLAEFGRLDGLAVPDRPFYLLRDIERGDEMRNCSPALFYT